MINFHPTVADSPLFLLDSADGQITNGVICHKRGLLALFLFSTSPLRHHVLVDICAKNQTNRNEYSRKRRTSSSQPALTSMDRSHRAGVKRRTLCALGPDNWMYLNLATDNMHYLRRIAAMLALEDLKTISCHVCLYAGGVEELMGNVLK